MVAGPTRRPKTFSAHKHKPYSKVRFTRVETAEGTKTRGGDSSSREVHSSDDEESNEDDELDGEDGAKDGSKSKLIPKPAGENGRPSRGGYSVSSAVKYPAETWEEIEVRIFRRLPRDLTWSN